MLQNDGASQEELRQDSAITDGPAFSSSDLLGLITNICNLSFMNNKILVITKYGRGKGECLCSVINAVLNYRMARYSVINVVQKCRMGIKGKRCQIPHCATY